MLKLAYGLLLSIVGAVLVHIAVLFLIPRLNEPQIYTQLQNLSQTRDPLVFSGAEETLGIKGLDPFFRYRVCFYDLADGYFQLSSTGDVPFFSAALLSEDGNVLFSITDRQTIDRTLSIEVRPAFEQQRLSQAVPNETQLTGAVPVFVSANRGYAIVRSFVPDKSFNDIVQTFLTSVLCQSTGTDTSGESS